MAINAGAAELGVLPKLDPRFNAMLTSQLGSVEKTLNQSMQSLGSTLTRSLTPVAGGIAVAWGAAFKSVDTGQDAIRTGSGATGQALANLEQSARDVAGNVTQPFDVVGQVISELSQRTGQTGESLEDLSTSVLNLAKVTGEDAVASV